MQFILKMYMFLINFYVPNLLSVMLVKENKMQDPCSGAPSDWNSVMLINHQIHCNGGL